MSPERTVHQARRSMLEAYEADRRRGLEAAASVILDRYRGDRRHAAFVVRGWAANEPRWNEVARIIEAGGRP